MMLGLAGFVVAAAAAAAAAEARICYDAAGNFADPESRELHSLSDS